jgi:inner membrane protein YidH
MSTKSPLDSVATELSARRTGMSFQRTRLSADRTLMSVIRTSLSMIGFGFTIFQFFQKLKTAGTLPGDLAPRRFGLALVFLGVGILVLGIIYDLLFMHGLRKERAQLTAAGMLHGESGFPISFTLIIAVLLLTIGLLAIVSMVFEVGPFG